MRVLLDECVDARLKPYLTDHEVTTVPEAGWAGKQNGELLKLASGRFDVFLTVDQNIKHQQNIAAFSLVVVVLNPAPSSLPALVRFVPRINQAIWQTRPGNIVVVGL